MRTKLALGAAVLAAGLTTTMAQVYSLNIVGYCNVPVPKGFSYASNPLDNGNNAANVVFDNSSGTWNNVEIHSWVRTGFEVVVFDNDTGDTTTGFMNRTFTGMMPAPVLSSGKGFLLNNPNASAMTNTFVGTVRTGTNTMTIAGSTVPTAAGSLTPQSGGITTIGMENTSGAYNNVEIMTLLVAPNGNALGYNVAVFDNDTGDTTTGFMNRTFTAMAPEPQISIGQGFFIHNPNSTPMVWTQLLNP